MVRLLVVCLALSSVAYAETIVGHTVYAENPNVDALFSGYASNSEIGFEYGQAIDTMPFSLWNGGTPHAFEFVFDGNSIGTFRVDNVSSSISGLELNSFDSFLLSIEAADPVTFRITNFLFGTVFTDEDVEVTSEQTWISYQTNRELSEGFIMYGTIEVAEGDVGNFNVSLDATPEPSSLMLLLLVASQTRRR